MRVRVPKTFTTITWIGLVVFQNFDGTHAGIPKRSMVRCPDCPVCQVVICQTEVVKGVYFGKTCTDCIRVCHRAHVHFDTHIFVVVVAEHVQVDHAADFAHFGRMVGDIFFTAPEPLLFTGKENQFDGVVKLVITQKPGSFHEGSDAAGVIFSAWRERVWGAGGAVHMGSHQYEFVSIWSVTGNGDYLVFPGS